MTFSGGQTADVRMFSELMAAMKPKKVIAGKAYDEDWLLHCLDSEGIEAVIPLKANRLQRRIIDYKAYKHRNVIERTINRLKQYQKIATRYEKTVTFFLALGCFTDSFFNLDS